MSTPSYGWIGAVQPGGGWIGAIQPQDAAPPAGGNRRRRVLFWGTKMVIAKQSTAFETAIGPVLDADGVAVTDCVVSDFKLKKTSGNFAALNGSATLTHVSAGMYDLVLTTSDTDTVGVCCVAIDDTTNACAPLYLQVVEEAVFDAMFAASAPGYLQPTTAGRTLDVSAGGEAGIDWSNVGSPTTSLALTGTTIADAQKVDVNTIKTQTVTLSGGVTIPAATLASTTNITGGTITTVTNLTNAPTAGDLTATMKTSVNTEVASALGTYDPPTKAELDAAVANVSVDEIQATAIADLFNTDSGTTYASAVAGSAVKEIADNAGGSALTTDAICEAMFTFDATATYATANAGSVVKQIADNAGGSALTVEAIADGVWDEATAGHTTSGTFGEQLKTDVDAILADTVVIGTPAGASMSADIAAVKTDTGNLVTRITSTLFSGITSLAQWLGLIAGKQTGDSTARTELRATGAGSGTYDETTDSTQAIRDRGDSAWITATGFSTHSAADVWSAGTRTLTAGTNIQLPSNGLANVTAWTVAITGNITGNLSGSVSSVTGNINTASGTIQTLDALDTAQDSQHSTTQGLVTTVDGVVDAILLDTGTDGVVVAAASKTGYALSATGMDLVVPADPSAIPVLGTANIVTWIGYFGAWTVNEVNVTATQVNLRNSADNDDMATHTISDDGTTFSSSEPS